MSPGVWPNWGTSPRGLTWEKKAIRLAEAVAQPNSMVVVLYCVGLFYRRHGMLQRPSPCLNGAWHSAKSVDIPLRFPMTASLLECGVCPGRVRGGGPAAPGPDAGAPGHRNGRAPPCASAHRAERGACSSAAWMRPAPSPHISSSSPTPTPGPVYRAHALRLLGEVARRREPPDLDQAATHYRQALTLAEAVGMRPLQAHCHLGLGCAV